MDLSNALQIWWVLPVSIGIATVALSSGISGALFFSPFFLLIIGLEPAQAIGAGLMTELFGTAFGSYNYVRQGVVDFHTARRLLMASIPAGIVGAFSAHYIEPGVLQTIFGAALAFLALIVLYNSTQKTKLPISQDPANAGKLTVVRARDGSTYSYRTCNYAIAIPSTGLSAFLTGLMSAGLPEFISTYLIVRCHTPPRVAVGTAIFILTVTVFFAVGVHALVAQPAWHVVIWSIPGVTIGAQIGPRIPGKMPPHITQRVLGSLFLAVGVLVIALQI